MRRQLPLHFWHFTETAMTHPIHKDSNIFTRKKSVMILSIYLSENWCGFTWGIKAARRLWTVQMTKGRTEHRTTLSRDNMEDRLDRLIFFGRGHLNRNKKDQAPKIYKDNSSKSACPPQVWNVLVKCPLLLKCPIYTREPFADHNIHTFSKSKGQWQI